MGRDQIAINEVLGRTTDRPLIGIYMVCPERAEQRLLDRFVELEWQAVHLGPFSGRLPKGTPLTGAILTYLPTDDIVRQLLDQGVPCVRLGKLPHPLDHVMPAVISDFGAEGRLAAEHFAERGFRHVGFVGRIPWSIAETLYEGFRAGAEALGMSCHLLSLEEDRLKAECPPDLSYFDMQRIEFQSWVQRSPGPLGLLATNDPEGNRYCHWAIESGLRVPEDVAVMAVGNNPMMCQGALVPLTAIERDHLRMIDASIDRLGLMLNGTPPKHSTLAIPPRTVVTRRSTDVLAASDPRVVSALGFMWDHVHEDLSVDQIARHVDVSRSTLEKVFRREIGRSINVEFQRRRLEKSRELIRSTQLPIAEIVTQLSYSSPAYFCRVFKAAYGVTPASYRRDETRPGDSAPSG